MDNDFLSKRLGFSPLLLSMGLPGIDFSKLPPAVDPPVVNFSVGKTPSIPPTFPSHFQARGALNIDPTTQVGVSALFNQKELPKGVLIDPKPMGAQIDVSKSVGPDSSVSVMAGATKDGPPYVGISIKKDIG